MKKVRILPRASLPPPIRCRRQDDAVATPPAFANRPLSAKQTPHGRGRPSSPRPPATTDAGAAAAAAAARCGGRSRGPHRRGGGQCQVAGQSGKPLWRRVGRAPPPVVRRRGACRRAGARRQRRPRLQRCVWQKQRRRRWRRRPRFSHGRHRGGSEDRAPLAMDLSDARKRALVRRRPQSHAQHDGRRGVGGVGNVLHPRRLSGGRGVGVRLASGLIGRQRAVAHPPSGGGSPPADAPQSRGQERERACLFPTRWRRRSASCMAARAARRPNRLSNRCRCRRRWRPSVPPPSASAVASATSVARRRASG